MDGEVQTDERGRMTIPKEMRGHYGEKFRLVESDSGIRLVPILDDPLAELRRKATSAEFRETSPDELEDAAREEARRQASEHVR